MLRSLILWRFLWVIVNESRVWVSKDLGVIPVDWQQQDPPSVSPGSHDLPFSGSSLEEKQTMKLAHKSILLNCIRRYNIILSAEY